MHQQHAEMKHTYYLMMEMIITLMKTVNTQQTLLEQTHDTDKTIKAAYSI